jgi:hypothetical protein
MGLYIETLKGVLFKVFAFEKNILKQFHPNQNCEKTEAIGIYSSIVSEF